MRHYSYEEEGMANKVSPLFITPLVYNDFTVNGVINTALIEALPDYFEPVVLGSIISKNEGRGIILKVYEDIFVRAFLKYCPKSLARIIKDLPDKYYYQWYFYALRKGNRYLKSHNISYLHSISVPYSSHLVALELKKKYHIPWVAQFYEPWCDNTYRIDKKWVWEKNKRWEKVVAENADLIIHNSGVMVESWKKRYGKIVEDKIIDLPMSFNFNQFKAVRRFSSNKDKLHICHIGNFYRLRRADLFLKSLAALFNETPSFKEKIEVSFIGEMTKEDLLLIKELGLKEVVHTIGKLSEKDCIDYYENADLFLVIESPDQGQLFFPSKLVRYYYYRKPILGLTCKDSVLYNQLLKNGHQACESSDVEGIKQYLKKAVSDYPSLLNINQNAWSEFEAKNVASKYSEIIDRYLVC